MLGERPVSTTVDWYSVDPETTVYADPVMLVGVPAEGKELGRLAGTWGHVRRAVARSGPTAGTRGGHVGHIGGPVHVGRGLGQIGHVRGPHQGGVEAGERA